MSKVEARVLVLDHRDEERERLRAVLREHHLQGIVAETEDHLFDLLAANIGASAVFLSQDDRTLGSAGVFTLRNLHYQRAELPIFFRSSDTQKMPKILSRNHFAPLSTRAMNSKGSTLQSRIYFFDVLSVDPHSRVSVDHDGRLFGAYRKYRGSRPKPLLDSRPYYLWANL